MSHTGSSGKRKWIYIEIWRWSYKKGQKKLKNLIIIDEGNANFTNEILNRVLRIHIIIILFWSINRPTGLNITFVTEK